MPPSDMYPNSLERPLDGLSETDAALVRFAQRLVGTPSLPGEERAVSALVADEMAADPRGGGGMCWQRGGS